MINDFEIKIIENQIKGIKIFKEFWEDSEEWVLCMEYDEEIFVIGYDNEFYPFVECFNNALKAFNRVNEVKGLNKP